MTGISELTLQISAGSSYFLCKVFLGVVGLNLDIGTGVVDIIIQVELDDYGRRVMGGVVAKLIALMPAMEGAIFTRRWPRMRSLLQIG
ncbi:hypothetical protein DSUL_50465 [Desulfovibrionales bacterium]